MSRKQRAPLAKQGAPRRDSPAADDAATSPSSAIALKSAGFLATEDDQKKFASRILARAYSRMDLPTFRAPIFGGGAALAAAGAVLSFARDQTSAMAIAAGAAGVLAVAFVASTVRERARRDKDSVFDPRGCYLDENGLLVPLWTTMSSFSWCTTLTGAIARWSAQFPAHFKRPGASSSRGFPSPPPSPGLRLAPPSRSAGRCSAPEFLDAECARCFFTRRSNGGR